MICLTGSFDLIENDFQFQFHTIQTKNAADVNRGRKEFRFI